MFSGQIFFTLKYPNPGKREGRWDKYLETDCFFAKKKQEISADFETICKVLKCLFPGGLFLCYFRS
ncbi:MAG: hypothetical protein ACI8PB_001362 [Desulforhopalus sp.]|jgi:hypothetical protein